MSHRVVVQRERKRGVGGGGGCSGWPYLQCLTAQQRLRAIIRRGPLVLGELQPPLSMRANAGRLRDGGAGGGGDALSSAAALAQKSRKKFSIQKNKEEKLQLSDKTQTGCSAAVRRQLGGEETRTRREVAACGNGPSRAAGTSGSWAGSDRR